MKNVDPSQVVAVDFDPDDIVLIIRGFGQIRIERSALPATIEALPDTIEEMLPAPSTTEAQPVRGRKQAKSKRSKPKVV